MTIQDDIEHLQSLRTELGDQHNAAIQAGDIETANCIAFQLEEVRHALRALGVELPRTDTGDSYID